MPNRANLMEGPAAAGQRVARIPGAVHQPAVSDAGVVRQAQGARVPPALGGAAGVRAMQGVVGNAVVMRMQDAERTGAAAIGRLPVVQATPDELEEDEESVQRVEGGLREPSDEAIRSAAAEGVRTPSTTLPYLDRIQASFGRHSIAHVQAHVGPEAARASRAMNALAYASGDHVVFGSTPDLRTAAHEAAHIVQQQAGVQLSGGIGRAGDPYERHADAVADAVVAGGSAEGLLEPRPLAYREQSGRPSFAVRRLLAAPRVQRRIGPLLAHPLSAAAPRETAIQREVKIAGFGINTLEELVGQAEGEENALEAWNVSEKLDKEIAERLLTTGYEYESITGFLNEVRMRKQLIRGLELVEKDNNLVYNHKGDNLKLPPAEWSTVEAYDEKGSLAVSAKEKEDGGAAFRSRNTPASAIDAIFGQKTEEFFLECNTATVAIHYRALKEVLGTEAFNDMFADGITLMPEWLTTERFSGNAPSLKLIPKTRKAVDSIDDLVPGDWVYFVNFSDYALKHPKGAFTGENALYMGAGMFRGFGVDAMSESDMNKYLMDQYNKDLPKNAKKTKRERSTETLDGQVPGIDKTEIRRAAEGAKIRSALDPY